MKKIYLLLAVCFALNANAQFVNIPNANFKALLLLTSNAMPIAYNAAGTQMKIDSNNDGNISVAEASLVHRLALNGVNNYVTTYPISDLTGINEFANLRRLVTARHPIGTLNLSSLQFLQYLDCSSNQLTSLTLTSLPALQTLMFSTNAIAAGTVDFSGVPNLKSLYCDSAGLTSLNLAGLPLLETLSCKTNTLTALNLTAQHALITLDCSANDIVDLQLHAPSSVLKNLTVTDNNLVSYNFNAFPNLEKLYCGRNPYTSLNIDSLVHLKELDLTALPVAMLPISNANAALFTQLETLGLGNVNFQGQTDINFTLFTSLEKLNLRQCNLSQLSLSSNTLKEIYLSINNLTGIDLTNLPNLEAFEAANNLFTDSTLIFNYNAPLNFINLGDAPTSPPFCMLTNLDFSSFDNLQTIQLSGLQYLTTLNIKNGFTDPNGEGFNLLLQGCNALQYICTNETMYQEVQSFVTYYNLTNCHVNTYCSFTPGGEFYYLQGTSKLDFNVNGCDANDIAFSNLRLNISNGTTTGSIVIGPSGNYNIPLQAGTYTVTPVAIENPSNYTISPASATITLPGTPNPFVQNFCLTPTGTFADLQISMIPYLQARPGFNSDYKIIYKNAGYLTVPSGSVNLAFNDAVLNYYSSSVPYSGIAPNQLTWNFSNLLPQQTREINVTLTVNSPMQTPPVNGGDILPFTATIDGAADVNTNNNTAVVNQMVVNSFDPNDKTCLQGATIPLARVGDYVHYRIRFENTGTANAQNIVVRDVIDTAKFDINSLVQLDGSHPFTTRISNTNQVEFIFQNIQLPFDDANNDGYVVFKIKTKPALVLGSTFSNSASIYFDYNFPIITDTYTTTVAALANPDLEFSNYFSLSPNPAKSTLNIQSKEGTEISSISIYNVMGQLMMVVPTASQTQSVDVSQLATGNYFVKIISGKGTATSKFIKE